MKKFILPILVAVVTLSSCSQALYKNSYNWVKVEPKPTAIVTGDTAEKAFTPVVISEKHSIAANNEIIQPETEITFDSSVSVNEKVSPIEKMKAPVKEVAGFSDTRAVKQMLNRNKIITRGQKNVTSTDLAWDSETLGLLAGLLLVILLLSGATKILTILLYAYYIVVAIAGLIACAAIIYGIFWLLFGDISMDLFWWTSK